MNFAAKTALICALLFGGAESSAFADDVSPITIADIVPAVGGTEVGNIVVAAAPAPGTTRTIRRSEVIAALRNAGRDSRGLAIPANTRIHRGARRIERDEFQALALSAVNTGLAPCVAENVEVPAGAITVGEGHVSVRAEGEAPRSSGRAIAIIVIEQGDREQRIPVRAEMSCPAPVIRPGSRISIRANVGNVRASVPGEARQTGRVGDVIRVVNTLTNASLSARVVSSEAVEVIR